MPMLQSDSSTKALRYLPAPARNFIAYKRRYGAGVSTSGSQPENPGSIPGTATNFFFSPAPNLHNTAPKPARESLTFNQSPESYFTPAPSAIVTPMPEIKNLECSRCQATISAATPQTLCPKCKGSLYVRYDLQPLRGTPA